DGGNAGFVTDAVGKRRLIHTAIDWLLGLADLSGRAIDHVDAGGLEEARNFHSIIGSYAALDPIVCRDADRHGQVLRPYLAHGLENLERIAHAVFERTTVFVVALVG